ncbi:hypothetical protein [Bifidobacterium longum]|uniref:hypothetical protein n=1 Tax=Bifidobacterium longum TaxID=216816 RepID=UPI0030EB4A3E
MSWLLVGLALFLVFGLVMVFALCRAARLGDEMADKLADRRDVRSSDGGEPEC